MKLKKIASLALAGVMAVSMLAGCSTNKGGDATSDTTDTNGVSAAAFVDAVNNGQSIKNKVKVNFTYNADMEDAANKAVDLYGGNQVVFDQTNTKLPTAMKQYMPSLMDTEANLDNFFDDNKLSTEDNDGDTVTCFMVGTIGSTGYSEAVLKNAAAKSVDSIVAQLDDTTKTTATKVDAHYQDYSYTGSFCVFEAETTSGTTVYYMAVVLTQTVTDHVLEK